MPDFIVDLRGIGDGRSRRPAQAVGPSRVSAPPSGEDEGGVAGAPLSGVPASPSGGAAVANKAAPRAVEGIGF